MPGYVELEFDLPGALLKSVLEALHGMDRAALTEGNVAEIPEEQGIYALNLAGDDRITYIGKTDSDAGLRHRLTRHAGKLVGRRNIGPGDVEFRAVRLFVFTAMDIESALIRHFGGVQAVAWNNSGFGSNDPGKERDTTNYKVDHWDTQYPIELDQAFVEIPAGRYTVGEVMARLKAGLPYNLRYQRPGRGRNSVHADYKNTNVELPKDLMTTREVLKEVMAVLPPGWHATALPSHIISYKEDGRKFPSGVEIARS